MLEGRPDFCRLFVLFRDSSLSILGFFLISRALGEGASELVGEGALGIAEARRDGRRFFLSKDPDVELYGSLMGVNGMMFRLFRRCLSMLFTFACNASKMREVTSECYERVHNCLRSTSR